ncbi:hypothetical protein ACLQ2N_33020 [Streptomyces sp. DT224]|uniref:hypothetical protein n=1 Tax=Streptomyces sp. DT224 TaxID=3393426 RepID=UPI003CED460E
MADALVSEQLMRYLDRMPGHYSDDIVVMLYGTDIPGPYFEEFADRLRRTALAHGMQAERRRGDIMPDGLTSVAAQAAATWLASYLKAQLPPAPAPFNLHQQFGYWMSGIWGNEAGPGRLHAAFGPLSRSTAQHADDLRRIGAWTTVRQLSGYVTTSDITAAHGQLVHNVLRLALPRNRPGQGRSYLTLGQALEVALIPAPKNPRSTRARRMPVPHSMRPETAPTAPKQHPLRLLWSPSEPATAHDAYAKAMLAQPPELLANPAHDARGIHLMLSTKRPLGPDADIEEIEQLLAAANVVPAPSITRGDATFVRTHIGLIVLAAEIAARTLLDVIAEEQGGPDGFEALDSLIHHIYPQQGPPADTRYEHPVMAVERMLRTPYGSTLPAWQRRAIRVIMHRYTAGRRHGVRADALISAEIAPHCRKHSTTIARVRHQVVTAHLESASAPTEDAAAAN